jgi:HAD superfamily hydrolase (TIGR01484 family)
MRFTALATDYDGTLATDGFVESQTVEALRRLRQTGRRVILVTGRTMVSLREVFPRLQEFDSIVAENGGTLYDPATGSERLLAEAPSEAFLRLLQRRVRLPLEVGRAIVATSENEKQIVLNTIQDLGLELQIIFNKGSLMILPSGVNKATGLAAAVKELGLSIHSVVGIGDAENDHAFLAACEFSVAVANALPSIKEQVHLVTSLRYGRGVAELIQELVETDLAERERRPSR